VADYRQSAGLLLLAKAVNNFRFQIFGLPLAVGLGKNLQSGTVDSYGPFKGGVNPAGDGHMRAKQHKKSPQ
jgi:hypothetical protein